MTTDQTPEAAESAAIVTPATDVATDKPDGFVAIGQGYWFDPARSVVIDDESGEETDVYINDGLVLSLDGETFGTYDPEAVPPDEEADEPDAIAPTWAERMVARLARYVVRGRVLGEEIDRLDLRRRVRLDELTAGDEEYQLLVSQIGHVDRVRDRSAKALEFLTACYKPVLLLLAEDRLKKSKRRTFDLLAGALALRSVPPKVALVAQTDEEIADAVESLLSLGQEDAVPRSIKVSKITDDLKAKILAGEATVSGFAVEPARQELTIKAGGSDVK